MLELARPLLAFIGKHESGNNYNSIWGGIRKSDYPPVPLVEMNVAQILAWQDRIDSRYMSEAAGCYQILEDTLRGLMASADVRGYDLYNVATQDKLGLALLVRRGLHSYLDKKMTPEQFGQSLSMEWASLPCMIKDKYGRAAVGQSYYANDGLNKSGTSKAELLAIIKALQLPAVVTKPVAQPVSSFAAAMSVLVQSLSAWFGAKQR